MAKMTMYAGSVGKIVRLAGRGSTPVMPANTSTAARAVLAVLVAGGLRIVAFIALARSGSRCLAGGFFY
ncbi:hypothetical protein [Paraburkholderia sp. ZP32-5]|uniref:hypothetical protein n=1 Tax=Paraburkholderia sp. ZP32-5 TaxID=2883245 RepID=UPI001F20C20B|nr:hypothetical protein [Paraburkholderia sp. ZP32-5]